MAPHKPFSAILLSVSLCLTALAGTKSQLTAPLDDTLWESSQWISAADAPVVTGRIEGGNERAADGASWFLSAIKNPAEVASARWMTTGLGVYSLYINGKPIGEEHYAYGCVGEWLWETAAGIASEPSDPGFKTIVMRPVPDRRLGSLDAVYRSPQGVIESHWKYDGDDWAWTFTVPEGSQAKVTLPGQTQETVYAPGTHSVKLSLPE